MEHNYQNPGNVVDLLQLFMFNNESSSIDYEIFQSLVLDYLLSDEVRGKLCDRKTKNHTLRIVARLLRFFLVFDK